MLKDFFDKIKKPDREFTPIPFWFLNDDFDDAEICRQLEDFCDKGVYGVVLHPRLGVPKSIPYLSDRFIHYIRVAVEKAASLGMYVVLYDEAMYPSGSAHGLVVAENPKFASQAIILTDDPNAGKIIVRCPDGKYIVQVDSGGRIRGYHFGEDDGENDAPLAADLLNQDSVDAFIRITHERYYNELKEYFGSTIIGFFTDEPSALGRGARENCFAWTWDFEDLFTSLGGKLEDLEALFKNEKNSGTELYRKAIFQRELDVYYNSLHRFCVEHGVDLMGHPHSGDDIECEKYFGVPGQDIVWRFFGPETDYLSGSESAQGKCSSDAARFMNRRRNSNECFGVCVRNNIPWYMPAEDMKWYIDYLGIRGVNLFIPHAFFYSVEGARKDERPPDVGPNSIWWDHYNIISNYMKRISYIMTDSVNEAKVCVLCDNRNMHVDDVRDFYCNQIEFNYLPYSAFYDQMIKDGKLSVGKNIYDYVYCDTRDIVKGVNHINGINDLSYRDIYTDIPCPDLRVSRLKKDDVRMIFLTNEGNSDISTNAYIDGTYHLLSYDLWRGNCWKMNVSHNEGKSLFYLDLKKRESLLLILDEQGIYDINEIPEKKYVDIDFTLTDQDDSLFVKTYNGVLYLNENPNDSVWISLTAEEMVECFVNGEFVGVSFWNKHEFDLSDYVKCGENIITLKITGNIANRFTECSIPYGLNIYNKL